MNNTDKEYFRLLDLILKEGRLKKNRTGIDTTGVFGAQAKFDVNLDAFPILTTKKVWFKGIVHELLWFIKGDTNIKYLVDNGVHIWDEWAYKKYLAACGAEDCNTQEKFIKRIEECPVALRGKDFNQENWDKAKFAVQWGDLGEGTYGGMWRHFPYYDSEQIDPQVGYVDQLQKVIDKLKTNPDDRRIIVTAWHPYWVDHCALPPCHCLFHFNTEELNDWERSAIATNRGYNVGITSVHEINEREFDKLNIPKRKLNLLLYQRSCDTFLGVPFNITSYSLLLAMMAHCVGMEPGVFTHTYGDLHIYENHLLQVKLQLCREPRKLPRLILNPEKRDLFSFEYKDITLSDYDPHPPIKGEVAV